VEHERQVGQRPDGMLERVLLLERRVAELERQLLEQRSVRGRSRLFFMLGIVVYLLFLYWQMKATD